MRLAVGSRLALLLVVASCAPAGREAAPPAAYSGLPWVDDDYPTALAEARARQLPIFVDSWAPW